MHEAGHADALRRIGQDKALEPCRCNGAPHFHGLLVPDRQVGHVEQALARHFLIFDGGVIVIWTIVSASSGSPSDISEPAWVTPEFW